MVLLLLLCNYKMTFSYTLLFTSLLAVCSCSFIEYDVKVTEMSGDHEIRSDEKAIYIDESFLPTTPPSIVLDDEADEETVEIDEFFGREVYNLTDTEYEIAFGKVERHHDEHMNFDLGFGAGIVNSNDWGPWTCCRDVVYKQSREKKSKTSTRIEMQYRRCSTPNCPAHTCRDNEGICAHFMASMGKSLCDPNNPMSTFMSHHCPKTCNYCGGRAIPTTMPTTTVPWWMTTTKRPWWETTTTKKPRTTPWWMTTTRAPATAAPTPRPINSNLVKITVLAHTLNQPYPSYKYTISRPVRIRWPWRRIRQNSKDIASFYLYKKPTDVFKTAIRFCAGKDNNNNEKWTLTKRRCSQGNGWTQKFVLYGSIQGTSNTQLYYVGNRGTPHWNARVSKTFPSSGYTRSIFYFYGPKSTGNPRPQPVTTPSPWTQRPNTRPTRPSWTPKPSTRPTRPSWTPKPSTRPTRPSWTPRPVTRPTNRPGPVGGGQQPTNAYNRECLEAHNFFRAVHNVPALQWSSELAKTSERWANALKQIAPERPDRLVQPNRRTRNWPHSESGTGNRNRGDGENIAWDLSGDGSPAKESVLRWYSEIFYYNRQHPTHSNPGKPVGHLTQMLWRDTTHLGCARSITEISQYRQKSTWSVAHYSPGGNVRYGNSIQKTLELYNEQVPEMRRGSCMLKSGACNNGNQCAAFGPAQGSCSCARNLASCKSSGGCIAWCENKQRKWNWKEECRGSYSCECTAENGAVCN